MSNVPTSSVFAPVRPAVYCGHNIKQKNIFFFIFQWFKSQTKGKKSIPLPSNIKSINGDLSRFPLTTILLLTFPQTSSISVPLHSNQTLQQLLLLMNTAAAGFGGRPLSWCRTADLWLRGNTRTLPVCSFALKSFQVINSKKNKEGCGVNSHPSLCPHRVKCLHQITQL